MSLPSPIRFDLVAEDRHTVPPLCDDEIHIWKVDLRADDERIAPLSEVLSSDELQRLERFRFERHRRRYLVGRAALRDLLAHYSGLRPAELSFSIGPKGKPSLEQDPALHFSLSHSGDCSVIALSRRGPLGVDIERRRDLRSADDLARRFFSPAEVEAYFALEEAARGRAFFDCWTRKEAVVKALGEGLLVSLDSFDVSLAPGEPTRVLRFDGYVAGDHSGAAHWDLVELEVATGFAGALATPWQAGKIRAWDTGHDGTRVTS